MTETTGIFKFVLTVIILTIVGILGYFIFLGFMNKDQLLLSLFPLAVVAGLASFFSPCAFPLLPAAVTANLKSSAKTSPFVVGLVSASGLISLLLLVGLVIAIIGQPLGVLLQNNLRVIRGVIGILLLYLAFRQISDKFHFGLLEKLTPRVSTAEGGGLKNAYIYGFGYTLAGSGCTIPILGGLALGAISSGGFGAAFSSFAIAGAIMASLMFVFMGLTGYVKGLSQGVLAATPKIKKASAVVLFLVGVFYIANAIFKFV
ncbi:MAG: cytochrome c biogenesis CcdA family protein [Candidatus Brocadiales bacterium]